jgi:predicted DNA-binding transcriptional regulator AlpA
MDRVKAGKFPAPRSLGGQARQNRIAWLESEVAKWVRERPVREYRGAQTLSESRAIKV